MSTKTLSTMEQAIETALFDDLKAKCIFDSVEGAHERYKAFYDEAKALLVDSPFRRRRRKRATEDRTEEQITLETAEYDRLAPPLVDKHGGDPHLYWVYALACLDVATKKWREEALGEFVKGHRWGYGADILKDYSKTAKDLWWRAWADDPLAVARVLRGPSAVVELGVAR